MKLVLTLALVLLTTSAFAQEKKLTADLPNIAAVASQPVEIGKPPVPPQAYAVPYVNELPLADGSGTKVKVIVFTKTVTSDDLTQRIRMLNDQIKMLNDQITKTTADLAEVQAQQDAITAIETLKATPPQQIKP